ncbi:MAG TPA: hypothetical protein VNX87_05610 [Candidatus Sulfotelmatobacter sp.]|jgi:hypothetical protein|nr:hypothetical protein [Candidatus Sulfotelmatobacter sp.]
MMRTLPIVILIVAVTVVLMFIGLSTGRSAGTVGIASGAALPGFNTSAPNPEQALNNFLLEVQRRNWDRAFSSVERTSDSLNEQSFIQEWVGSNGGLRSFSSLERFDTRPLHATNSEAQMRTRLHWSTPVGPVEDIRDFRLAHRGDVWKVIWDETPKPNVPAQIVPVNYLRWDLVTGSAGEEWGSHNVDAPNVRIVSMNAVDSAEGAVVMGEVVNEDTVPAFVNVNATLVDASGSAIDDESSFDKILHVLLPKQVTPYRIDFPHLSLSKVKNVRMDVKATLVPASSDPVIGVMNQKLETDAQGHSVLHGELLNESGQTVNIPHVIASFYDNSGKVVWVSDGYVEQALVPQSTESFAVEIPQSVAGKVQNFHVVVNQYSLQRS